MTKNSAVISGRRGAPCGAPSSNRVGKASEGRIRESEHGRRAGPRGFRHPLDTHDHGVSRESRAVLARRRASAEGLESIISQAQALDMKQSTKHPRGARAFARLRERARAAARALPLPALPMLIVARRARRRRQPLHARLPLRAAVDRRFAPGRHCRGTLAGTALSAIASCGTCAAFSSSPIRA